LPALGGRGILARGCRGRRQRSCASQSRCVPLRTVAS
jgi:hypothetical protein